MASSFVIFLVEHLEEKKPENISVRTKRPTRTYKIENDIQQFGMAHLRYSMEQEA